MSKKLRVAVIGLGVIGKLHAKIADRTENLVAVCDVKKSALSDYSDKLQYSDYISMLEEVKPDVVHVCTPHYLHCEMTVAALDRGINVLCEKPMCISEAEILTVLEAEKRSDAMLGICLQNRYINSCIKAKEYLRTHKPIYATGQVVWSRDKAYYAQDAWRGKIATEGGGVLINQAIHTLDILQWLVGLPEAVTSFTGNMTLKNVIDVEDTALIFAKGQTGFSFYATNGSVKDFPTEITVYTEADTIKIIKDKLFINDRLIVTEQTGSYNIKPSYGNKHDTLIGDFYSCVKCGKHFMIDGTEGSKSLRIVLSAYKSQGREIFLK